MYVLREAIIVIFWLLLALACLGTCYVMFLTWMARGRR
jgi:hypothetical protein